ncbi:hypothetical protein H310_11698 [Aphanomyces invadans]|uniref:ParB/Sulfiredoxin domain-containing protein n=1 Tax=Aphanomyces invadans TaxID=157072 RepID=A0A024TM73_9STRA|nr:hypothetical protein H310_11698 [Aphanomyces invadans]ETV94731.1 hypothetical protein H310_11698 [Aphanomyces invadans]|eukprot:XP_008876676.1 hypothetical protein H310_11698 [Aphanomyces invadans]
MKELPAADHDDASFRLQSLPHVHLVKVEWLKPHEAIVSIDHVEALLAATLAWGAYVRPLLVDIKTGAILDGHHRHRVAQLLQLHQLPCVLVDYLSDTSIMVEHWQGGVVDKQQVIDMALSAHVFPPKTSRHSMTVDSLGRIAVPLSLLRQPAPFTGVYSNHPLKRPNADNPQLTSGTSQVWAC